MKKIDIWESVRPSGAVSSLVETGDINEQKLNIAVASLIDNLDSAIYHLGESADEAERLMQFARDKSQKKRYVEIFKMVDAARKKAKDDLYWLKKHGEEWQ